MRKLAIAAFAALALSGAALAKGGPGSAEEPAGLFTGNLQSYTPATLKGAEVVEDAAKIKDLSAKGAILIDLAAADRKPEGLPPTTVWRPQHRSIPGAVWFPGAAAGDLPQKQEDALKARVSALTGGDMNKPVVAFCHPDCWGSWNMGKRLTMWGYKQVYWYPRGIEGWQESDNETSVVKADADWTAATKPDAGN